MQSLIYELAQGKTAMRGARMSRYEYIIYLYLASGTCQWRGRGQLSGESQKNGRQSWPTGLMAVFKEVFAIKLPKNVNQIWRALKKCQAVIP